MLFGDLRVIDRAWGRSLLGQLRHRTEVAMRIPGAASQPVYVLQKAE
jgi:hypothetical protein